MTLAEIRRSDLDFLYPKDVCEVLQCHPYSINVQAKEDPAKLGFPVTIIGTRVRIPFRRKMPFSCRTEKGVIDGKGCYRRSGLSERPQR